MESIKHIQSRKSGVSKIDVQGNQVIRAITGLFGQRTGLVHGSSQFDGHSPTAAGEDFAVLFFEAG